MPLTTVTVSIEVAAITGGPVPYGRVTFELTAPDFDGAVVAPEMTRVTLGADGTGSVDLWPNARGTEGTQYRVVITDKRGDLQLSGFATVPATDCDLHEVLSLPPPAAISTANLAASEGAEMIGFKQSGTGAVPTNLLVFLRSLTVRPEQFGAAGDDSTDDTAAFNRAVARLTSAGGGILDLDSSYYRLRDWEVPEFINVVGQGEATRLRFMSSGSAATDAASYVVKWTGAKGSLRHFFIDGASQMCNGLEVKPDANGMQRLIEYLKVGNIAGYKAGAAGGTFGVAGNYARADITDDAGSHLLTGGNGVVCNLVGASAAWELRIRGLRVFQTDGIGCNLDRITDSKISGLYVANSVYTGLIMRGANNEIDQSKVYLCNRLNVLDDFATTVSRMIPHQATIDGDRGAVILAGRNHTGRLEVQECASIGVGLGIGYQSISGGKLDLVVDGNGGVDASASGATQTAYRRPGVLLFNYWGVNVDIASGDLRSKDGYPRQTRAFQIISAGGRFASTSIGFVEAASFYRIKANTGADFTTLQIGYATPSNTVGTVFEARRTYPGGLSATFGTGSLEPANGNSIITATVLNQYNKDNGLDAGYGITGDAGDSLITVNGSIVQAAAIV